MNALQQLYDLEIENNRFLDRLDKKLDEILENNRVELDTSEHSEDSAD